MNLLFEICFISIFRYHEHTVDDDSVECETIVEEKCEDVTQGYTTSQDCTKWPVTKCGDVKTESTKKYSPETECKKVPIELCGPGSCPVEPGPEECHERTQTVRWYAILNIWQCINMDNTFITEC